MSDASPRFVDNFINAEQLRRWRSDRPGDDAPLPPRFSLLALFAISTGSAIYCGLLRLLGVYGVMLMFAVLIVLYSVRLSGPRRAIKRIVADMLAGIVLPIGCLAFDPGVFRSNGPIGLFGPFGFADQMFVYTLLGTEMLVLLVWLLVGGAFNSLSRSIIAGVLRLGSLICIGLGVILSVAGLLLLAFLEPIGLLGFVPWFTLVAFLSNARRAKAPAAGRGMVAAGTLLGFLLPLALATIACVGAWIVAPRAPALPAATIGLWQKLDK